MSYRIIYGPGFRDDVVKHVRYLRDQHTSEATIERWFGTLFDRIDDLEQWPRRGTVDDRQSGAVGRETRKLNYGEYVVFYQLDDEASEVRLVAFMHGARLHDE